MIFPSPTQEVSSTSNLFSYPIQYSATYLSPSFDFFSFSPSSNCFSPPAVGQDLEFFSGISCDQALWESDSPHAEAAAFAELPRTPSVSERSKPTEDVNPAGSEGVGEGFGETKSPRRGKEIVLECNRADDKKSLMSFDIGLCFKTNLSAEILVVGELRL